MILFRRLLGFKRHSLGTRWQIESHDDEQRRGFPFGLGFVTQLQPIKGGHGKVTLEFILVADQYRRKGIATAIIKAAMERWPNIVLTDAVSKGGAALLRSLELNERKPKQ